MEITEAREKIETCLRTLTNDRKVGAFHKGTFRIWAFQTSQILREIYGPAGEEFEMFATLSRDLPVPINLLTAGYQEGMYESLFSQRKLEIRVFLDYCIKRLDEGAVPQYRESEFDENEPPKMFIAHGGRHSTLDRMLKYLRALGIEPVVVEDLPRLRQNG